MSENPFIFWHRRARVIHSLPQRQSPCAFRMYTCAARSNPIPAVLAHARINLTKQTRRMWIKWKKIKSVFMSAEKLMDNHYYNEINKCINYTWIEPIWIFNVSRLFPLGQRSGISTPRQYMNGWKVRFTCSFYWLPALSEASESARVRIISTERMVPLFHMFWCSTIASADKT